MDPVKDGKQASDSLPLLAVTAGTVKDPVCGMDVNPKTSSSQYEFEGQTYHFCCVHCREKFAREPEKFVRPPVRSGEKQGHVVDSEGKSTCPMHPEVRQKKAGSCPKCGMALEPPKPSPPAAKTEYVCPMHPQIVRAAAGSCPICGMALEPRSVAAQEEENPELRDMRRRFWVSAAMTLPVLVVAMGDYIPGRPFEGLASMRAWAWLEMVL